MSMTSTKEFEELKKVIASANGNVAWHGGLDDVVTKVLPLVRRSDDHTQTLLDGIRDRLRYVLDYADSAKSSVEGTFMKESFDTISRQINLVLMEIDSINDIVD